MTDKIFTGQHELCEQSALQKAHNARIDDDLYRQRTMSETVLLLMKNDGGEKLRSRTWHGQFWERVWKCIVNNLSRAAGRRRRPLFLRQMV